MTNVTSEKSKLYSIKIKILFGIIISREDVCTTNVCINCVRRIDKFWTFREECLQKERDFVSVKRGVSSPSHGRKKISKTLDFHATENSTNVSDVDKFCASLCVRKGTTSAIHNHSFDGMNKFNFEQVWIEIKQIPKFIQMLNAVSGRDLIDDTVKSKSPDFTQ